VAIGQVLGAVIEGIEQRMLSESLLAGLPTGFADLDQKLSGLRPGNLIIIAGRPSMGKTAFALNIAEHVAVVARKPVAVFSLEMSGEELGHRSISSLGGVSIERLISGKQLDDDDWERMTVALGKLHEAPLVIDDSAGLTISQIAARARRIKRRQGLSLIVVDYLQLMGGETDNRTGNRNLELGDLTRRLKALAKDLHVPVIALSQLSRKVEDRPNKRPMMSDLRDSGSIEQDADVILMVYRDEYYNPASSEAGTAEILIAKNRMGATGDVMLAFQGEFCRFRSLTRDAVSRIAHARVTSQVQKPRKRGFND
jgi:replicative DNA helicase